MQLAQFKYYLTWLYQSITALAPCLLTGLLAGVLVLALGALIARFLLWEWLLSFEESCLLTIKEWSNPALDRLMFALTWLAQGEITIPVLLAVTGILLYRNQAFPSLILIIALGGSWILNSIFKACFRRKRPDLWVAAKPMIDYSYPSGHSMSAISFYGLLAVILTQALGIPLGITASIAILVTLGVGFSRMYLGVHWPTDVLSGWIVGGIWLGSCLYGLFQVGGA